MSFRRVPFLVLAVVVLVLAGSLAYFWRAYREPRPPEYGWGSAGTLSLDLALERPSIQASETLNFTATLTNTGPKSVRICPLNWGPDIFVSHDGQAIRGPSPHVEPATRPTDAEFNRMLVVLEPYGTYSRQGRIKNDTSGGPSWDLRPGMDCSVDCIYEFDEKRGYPALPVWTGEVRSHPEYFRTLP